MIDGPADLTELGAPRGYGWYRIETKNPDGKKNKLIAPQWSDRVHLWLNGEPAGLLGTGPGAADRVELAHAKGTNTLVALADNLGRLGGSEHMSVQKGACGHLWELTPIKLGKATLETCDPVDPFTLKTPIWRSHVGDFTDPHRTTWSFTHRRKSPIFLYLPALTQERVLLILNDEPIDILDAGSTVPLCLWPEQLRAGANVLQLAPMPGTDPDALFALAAKAPAFEGTSKHTGKAQWSFARWEQPKRIAFKAPAKGLKPMGPTWWRTTFKAPGERHPLMLDLTGMTKGQIYVNDRDVGRYFVADPAGKTLPSQQTYYIPEPFYEPGKDNTLVLFEEHGGNPSRVTIAIERGPTPFPAPFRAQ